MNPDNALPPRVPHNSSSWVGADVVGNRGELLGHIWAVYFDNATGHPAWAAVQGTRHTVVVPLEMSSFDGTTLHLPFGADKLISAPHHDPATEISYQDGDDLYRHYGLTPPARAPAAEPPEPDDSQQPRESDTGEPAEMIRSQERLRIGIETVVAARLRMRKYLVTEEQTFTVPVTREEITFDYEEIPPEQRVPDGGRVLTENMPTEETHEVIRYEERVVITKELVPVERVRLIRRVVTTDNTVAGQVRTELIDFEQTTPDSPGQRERHIPATPVPPAGPSEHS